MAADSDSLREQIVRGATALIDARILSASGHGNWSARIPGTDRILRTGASLGGLRPEHLAVLSLDGEVIDGGLQASTSEIIRMHTWVYRERPEVGSVVHTHSPWSTAFAVAGREMECYSEALARLGTVEPVPLAGYAPRGSDQAVTNIVDALRRSPKQRAVLLENHGILAFGPDVASAQHMVFALEETAQAAILASAIGGPKVIGREMALAAEQRRVQFEAVGQVSAS
jgi:L-fuculose-phosphate aldolase